MKEHKHCETCGKSIPIERDVCEACINNLFHNREVKEKNGRANSEKA